ncbi:MAG TPA: bifunctional methylenetetrahydrofolate dehydrogenase/methenyltetrahydrofolate cyclohydrolase FolD [Hyphomicrobiaceae bacterium]|nr:bifunctional methylenetetrahydrofolate dehydrogenase/methenyltetrahydrofolate cyclohydrolase FolD [Hyphomicrobiaceae bacterium]
MTTARIIDGEAIAVRVRREVAEMVAVLKSRHALVPGVAVVLVGDNPASNLYVRNKQRRALDAGMRSIDHRLPAAVSESELVALITALNRDADVHGILVQLPLPPHISTRNVIEAIDPMKDVDGFHPLNVGRLARGEPAPVPCTPAGCLMLAKSVRADLAGLEAVVIGRSNIVGKPMAQLLLGESCTVTMAHSRTRNLPEVARRAELLVVAVGRPEVVRGDWIRPGAIVIDVGINRIETGAGKPRLVGDVAFAEAAAIAGAITPVPGGVGPMTIAMLLSNTVAAACRQRGVAYPGTLESW